MEVAASRNLDIKISSSGKSLHHSSSANDENKKHLAKGGENPVVHRAEPAKKLSIAHNHNSTFGVSKIDNARPTAKLTSAMQHFVADISNKQIKDSKVVNMDQLATLNADLQEVIGDYEERPEFKVNERESFRKRQLESLIDQAEKDYAAKMLNYDQQKVSIDEALLEIHRKITEVQGATMITELKKMNDYLYYHNKVIQKIADINTSLDNQEGCSRFFCCFPSKEIVQKREQLKALYLEQEAFASNDRTRIASIITSKLEEKRNEISKQRDLVINNMPQPTAQALREELNNLQASKKANREAFYYTINPHIMLNLVRIQSFVKRMEKNINKSHTKAIARSDIISSAFLQALSHIVIKFVDDFNKLCNQFVCRPPADPNNKNSYLNNKISFNEYYARYHALEEDDKLKLINGKPKDEGEEQKMQNMFLKLFPEHVEPTLSAKSSPLLEKVTMVPNL